MGRWEYSGRVYRTFGHHQEDQEGQEHPKHGVLEDFGCLHGYFGIVPPHMIPFWNPWNILSILEGCTQSLLTTRKIRKVNNVQNMGFWNTRENIETYSPQIFVWGYNSKTGFLIPKIFFEDKLEHNIRL